MNRIEFLEHAAEDLTKAFYNGKPVLVIPPTCKLDEAQILVMWHKLRQIAEQRPLNPGVCVTPFPRQCVEIVQPCRDCGTRENVLFAPCPYASEIHDDYEPVWLCGDCSRERANDV